ncbi:hypothetical protein [Streptomyces sp. NPDC053367]|uniref:hypothetical protein n=1 Tax=Streptomyces sp. NPDC053367 TaxID=3365700 RepID=UPI0037D3561B
MSRTRQAARLAAHLSEVTGVRVELVYDNGPRWNMSWPDGPTHDQMRAHLEEALAGHHFPDMRDRQLHLNRGTTARAWAARAIASRREGTLAPAVTEGAAWRRTQLPGWQPLGGDKLTPEDHALLRHVDQLIEATAYPDQASAPEDEPLIEELLAAGSREDSYGRRSASEFDMARVLLNADRAPSAEQPPQLRPLPTPAPAQPRINMDAEQTAQTETATARFLRALPGAREVTTTGELAAILARLPEATPLFVTDHVVSHPGPLDDPVHAVVAHLTPGAEPADPDNPDSEYRMLPALGLTTIRVDSTQNAGAEFERDGVEPNDPLTRAEDRLTSRGDLDGGIRDAAHVVDLAARLLDEGAQFIPSDHEAHATVTVETSRLRHAAERLRKVAPDAQEASES